MIGARQLLRIFALVYLISFYELADFHSNETNTHADRRPASFSSSSSSSRERIEEENERRDRGTSDTGSNSRECVASPNVREFAAVSHIVVPAKAVLRDASVGAYIS